MLIVEEDNMYEECPTLRGYRDLQRMKEEEKETREKMHCLYLNNNTLELDQLVLRRRSIPLPGWALPTREASDEGRCRSRNREASNKGRCEAELGSPPTRAGATQKSGGLQQQRI